MEEVTYEDNIKECTECSSTIDDGDELIINEHAYCTECAFLCFECETIYAVSSQGREFVADEWSAGVARHNANAVMTEFVMMIRIQ